MTVQGLVSLVTAIAMLGDSLTAAPGSRSSAPPAPPGWTTVWVDDFPGPAGTRVSPANWRYDVGTGYPGGPEAWGTGEQETATSFIDNVHVDGYGHLLITPIKSDGTWTSGRIETERSDFAAPPGGQLQIAASIQLPNPASGLGYWPAFWLIGSAFRDNYTNWPGVGEIDIMESVNALSQHSATLHCGDFPAGPCNEPIGITSGLQACDDCNTGFHTYSVVIDRTSPETRRSAGIWTVTSTSPCPKVKSAAAPGKMP